MPLVRARAALASAAAGEPVVVLATDAEAPIDLAALAFETGRAFACERDGDTWRLTLAAQQ